MEATIAITISASSIFFFFIASIPFYMQHAETLRVVKLFPERRVPNAASGVLIVRQGADALAVPASGG